MSQQKKEETVRTRILTFNEARSAIYELIAEAEAKYANVGGAAGSELKKKYARHMVALDMAVQAFALAELDEAKRMSRAAREATETMVVHRLLSGLPLCGFSADEPKLWPKGHKWTDDAGLVNCARCREQQS